MIEDRVLVRDVIDGDPFGGMTRKTESVTVQIRWPSGEPTAVHQYQNCGEWRLLPKGLPSDEKVTHEP